MAQNAMACSQVTLTDLTDAEAIREWYASTASGASAPAAPATTDPSASPAGWSRSEPTVASDADLAKSAWRCVQVVWGDGTCEWGEVTLSASYEAAKRAYNRAVAAARTATSYVTDTSNGVKVHPDGNTADYVLIDADGMKIYSNGLLVATFSGNRVDLANCGRTAKINMCDGAVRVESDATWSSGGSFVAESYKVDSNGDEIIDTVFDHPYACTTVRAMNTRGNEYATAWMQAYMDASSKIAGVETMSNTATSLSKISVKGKNGGGQLEELGSISVNHATATNKTTAIVDADAINLNGDITYSPSTAIVKNRVLASPPTADGSPTFRVLVANDLPTVPASKGGTGLATLTNGSYLVGNGTSAVTLKTPSGVLSDIGALSTSGGTVTGTLKLTRTTNASAAADNKPALMIGAEAGEHLEFDGNEIMAKASGTTTGILYLNSDGGRVEAGDELRSNGPLNQKSKSAFTSRIGSTYPTSTQGNQVLTGYNSYDSNGEGTTYSQVVLTTDGTLYRSFVAQRRNAAGTALTNGFYLYIDADETRRVSVSHPNAWRKALHVGAATVSLASTTIKTKTVDTKVTLANIVSSDETLFSLSSGGIKCAVAGTIKISATLTVQGLETSSGCALMAYKNSTKLVETIGSGGTAVLQSVTLAPKCVTVAANDVIYMYARGTTVNGALQATSTYLTVEYVA